tara:strand:+ start:265 stop:546 length:282 start_codon:yes stop_codon:yes gene_type:complete
MYFDINKSQLSALGKLNKREDMKKAEVLKQLKETKTIDTQMLPVIGMSFEVFLRYSKLEKSRQEKIVEKAIKKLDPEYCGACECTPCDCGYGN